MPRLVLRGYAEAQYGSPNDPQLVIVQENVTSTLLLPMPKLTVLLFVRAGGLSQREMSGVTAWAAEAAPRSRRVAAMSAAQARRARDPTEVTARQGTAVLRRRTAQRSSTAAAARRLQRRRAQAPWHFLYFLPEPHQHGSLRPI